jgi:hypothetical protein
MLTWILLFLGAVACATIAAVMLFGPLSHGEQHENVVQFPADKRREKLG